MKISITGIVIKGQQQGAGLGFPTANIKIPDGEEISPGIYAGRVALREKLYGAALYAAGSGILEAFLMDFSGDLYGEVIEVEVLEKIREPIVFKDKSHAISQINEDIKACLQALSKK